MEPGRTSTQWTRTGYRRQTGSPRSRAASPPIVPLIVEVLVHRASFKELPNSSRPALPPSAEFSPPALRLPPSRRARSSPCPRTRGRYRGPLRAEQPASRVHGLQQPAMIEGQNPGDASRLAQLVSTVAVISRTILFADPVQHRLPLRVGAVDLDEDRVPLRVGRRVDQDRPHRVRRRGDIDLNMKGLVGGERSRRSAGDH